MMIYILWVYIATAAQYETKLMFKPGKFRNVRRFLVTCLKCTQGKLQAGVITQNITFHKARDELWGYVMVHDTERIRFRYGNQRCGIT
jgi:hypothetical protein